MQFGRTQVQRRTGFLLFFSTKPTKHITLQSERREGKAAKALQFLEFDLSKCRSLTPTRTLWTRTWISSRNLFSRPLEGPTIPTSRRLPPSPCRARRCHPPNSRNFCPRLKCRPRSNRCTSTPNPIQQPRPLPPATIAVIAPKRSRASPPRLQAPPWAQLPRDQPGYSSLRQRP